MAATKTSTSKALDTDSELMELFVEQLRDIYWAERQLTKALPQKASLCNDSTLSQAIKKHAEETQGQCERLVKIFQMLGVSPRGKKCEAMEGLMKEADELCEEFADSAALDAAIICAAQKIEHYEIATYGTLRAFANQLGLNEVASLLQETLEEESMADEKLSSIAEKSSNKRANA